MDRDTLTGEPMSQSYLYEELLKGLQLNKSTVAVL